VYSEGNIWFIFSVNNKNDIDPVLRNRLYFVEVDGYNSKDKYAIARTYILPKLMASLSLTTDIIFPEETLYYLIAKLPEEQGVRELEHALQTIVKRVNILKTTNNTVKFRFSIPDFALPLTLLPKHVDVLITENKGNKNLPQMYI